MVFSDRYHHTRTLGPSDSRSSPLDLGPLAARTSYTVRQPIHALHHTDDRMSDNELTSFGRQHGRVATFSITAVSRRSEDDTSVQLDDVPIVTKPTPEQILDVFEGLARTQYEEPVKGLYTSRSEYCAAIVRTSRIVGHFVASIDKDVRIPCPTIRMRIHKVHDEARGRSSARPRISHPVRPSRADVSRSCLSRAPRTAGCRRRILRTRHPETQNSRRRCYTSP